MGVVLIILGIVIAALNAFPGTTVAGIMLLIVGILAIPPFVAKASSAGKSLIITFGTVGIILCVIAGIIAGVNGFVGAIADAICKDWRENESKFYVCSQSGTASCNGFWLGTHKSYPNACNTYSRAADQTCCTKMKAANKDACITSDQEDTCKKAGRAWVGGWIAIIASIIGCVAACLGLGNCCNGYYDAPTPPVVQMVAMPGAVATPAVEATIVGAPAAPAVTADPVPDAKKDDPAAPPPPAPAPPAPPAASAATVDRGCCATGAAQ